MDRRTYLRGVAVGGVGVTAGCLGGSGDPNTMLDEPDRPSGVESEDLSYPAWGERIPDVSFPDTVNGERVTLRDVDRPALLTFFYSNCASVCPRLIGALREVQIHSVTNDYADAVGFYPITFDPARDTDERLREYGEQMNVDTSVGNWHFLRPATPERARTVLPEEFGFRFQRTEPADMEQYMFTHIGLVLLVNGDGYVERAYRNSEGQESRYIADLKAVRNGGGGFL
jgi:protein SCO1/2